MSQKEKNSLIRELEVTHRVLVADSAKIKRTMRDLARQLESREQQISDAEQSIVALRDF